MVSIHAPRVGSDVLQRLPSRDGKSFNPRSPCGERRAATWKPSSRAVFQSTLPVWGATGASCALLLFVVVSIHAPRVGSDNTLILSIAPFHVSIHAPRVGSDSQRISAQAHGKGFNPRSPCGERHDIAFIPQGSKSFNPRSPCGERLPHFRSAPWV